MNEIEQRLTRIEVLAEQVLAKQEDLVAMQAEINDLNEWRSKDADPVISGVKSAKSKLVGGLLVLGVIGSIFIGALTYFKEQILGYMGWQ